MSTRRGIRTLLLDSTRAEARRAAVAVRDFCRDEGLADEDGDMLELAVSEAASNVVRHAYGDEAGHPMLLKVLLDRDMLRVALLDQGRFFDPERLARAEMPEPHGELTPHGRGLAIMALSVDEIRYGRKGRWNELVLLKRVNRGECRLDPLLIP